MSSEDDGFSYTVSLQRGKTSDRDKHKSTVTADSINELEAKVEKVRELMKAEIAKTRTIQGSVAPDDDQATLDEMEGSNE